MDDGPSCKEGARLTRAYARGGKTLVVAVDGSPGSEAAAQFCLSRLAAPGDAVNFVTVYSASLLSAASVGAALMAEVDRDAVKRVRHRAQKVLAAHARAAAARGLAASTMLLQGTAKHALAELVRRERPDMMLIGTPGNHGFVSSLVGNGTADYLVHNSSCAVVVVPPGPGAGPVEGAPVEGGRA